MRVIVRRPHAYAFLERTFAGEGELRAASAAGVVAGEGEETRRLPIPGLYVLDAEGRPVDEAPLRAVDELLELLERPGRPRHEPERVSIRVEGFVEAAGIT